jgi:hypothetical protein
MRKHSDTHGGRSAESLRGLRPGAGRRRRPKTPWKDLPPAKRVSVLVTAAVQLALALAAWRDLARRPASQVNGNKGKWALIIALNYVGPVLYFLKGRTR